MRQGCTCDRVRKGEPFDPARDCGPCWLWHHDAAHRRIRGGDPKDVVPVRAAEANEAAPCRFEGRELTGPERQAAGLDHGRKWRHCDHPSKPLGPHVCPCKGCGPNCGGYERELNDGARIVIDHGASGIGDALLGLLAIPEGAEYRVSAAAEPFVRLFDGPVSVGRHVRGHSETAVPGARQMNLGYSAEQTGRYPVPRWERYRKNAGAPAIRSPKLRDPEAVRAAGADLPGRIVLSPWSADPARQWPVANWLELERRLSAAGWLTAVVHDRMTEETALFRRSALVLGQTAERVAGVMLGSRAVVANDSGMGHLGGILGVRTLILGGGYIPLDRVFGAYPRAEWMHRPRLADITPAEVFERLTRVPATAPTDGPPICIPYLTRPDLLAEAVASLGRHAGRAVVLDNSIEGLDPAAVPCRVVRPAVPLNMAQTYWWLQSAGAAVYYFMHADATLTTPEAVDQLDAAVKAAGPKWGLITTDYDRFAAFNGAAIRAAGVWPDVRMPYYGVDVDYYRRMRLAGLESIDRPEIRPLIHHPPRSANLADVAHRAAVGTTDHTAYYAEKWGGPPGAERYARPWNGSATPDRPRDRLPGRLIRLAGTVPFRAYTEVDDAEQARHLREDDWLYRPGKKRYLCSILGALEEELSGSRPDLARLVREAVFVGRRLNDFGTPQDDLDWTSPPKNTGGPSGGPHPPAQAPAGPYRLSVIIPTRGRDTLTRALASVAPQLIHGNELIVERDDSGDWGAAARTRAIERASGDYLIFLDDDDVWTPDALATVRAALALNPGRPHLFQMRYASGRGVVGPGGDSRR